MQAHHTKTASKNIAIISSCIEDWGGSEELWGRTVPYLIAKGHRVTVYKARINAHHPEFIKLAKLGVVFQEFDVVRPIIQRNVTKVWRKLNGYNNYATFLDNPGTNTLAKLFKRNKPDFAIISQGINFDGLTYGHVCYRLSIPYVVITQKAVDFYWPPAGDRPVMLKVLEEAKACYFVSKHNLRLTQEQFGKKLANGHVIFNPLKIGNVQPYPNITKGVKLACVGRLFVLDKGQDILIRIVSKDKWKNRPVSVTLVGTGADETSLKDMATLLDVKNMLFAGHVTDMDTLWQQYHALILPSRSEGLPLSIVEAMAAGRIVIVSRVGGNTELIEENATGFSGYPNEEDFEAAMERAWAQLDNWEQMGKEAARQIGQLVPALPEKDFAEHLFQFIDNIE